MSSDHSNPRKDSKRHEALGTSPRRARCSLSGAPGGRTEQQGRGARQGWPHSAQGGLAGPWACTSTVP